MHRNRMSQFSVALTALTLLTLGLPAVAQAQELPKDQVPFKATVKGTFQYFSISANPPIGSIEETGAGTATPLGDFKWAARLTSHQTADGQRDVFAIGDVGTFTAANGDALFVKYAVLPRPSSRPDLLLFEGAWTVTGGAGRFLGAKGSGVNRFEILPEKREVTIVWEGTVSAPK